MKRLIPAAIVAFVALPLFADDDQSYLSYDSGGTIVIQALDNREVEVGVNSPIFAGDQLVTSRRGRSEVRLSDGNILAVDRATAVVFHSMYRSYAGDDQQTVIELLRGQVISHQTEGREIPLRLDTRSATYQSLDEAIFTVESNGGRDKVAVFGGTVEVRTRERTYRLRAGERVQVDERGVFESSGLARDGMGDFERWYLRRIDDVRGHNARHLDTRLAYAEPMLDAYGSWVYVRDYGSWVWRPRVSVGWRPYYHGSWVRGRGGVLVWVSNEPWGWVPYHYGRWAYSGFHGWVWVPGSVYAPAWVYWVYGPSYVGWVPWGYYDYYRPYRGWLYHPRRTIHVGVGFGFWGRVHVSDRDLNHWTLVSPDHLVSNRVDRAALTTDKVRERLQRDGNRATFTDAPARFTREEFENPAEAVRTIARRAPGEGTGMDRSGSQVDATQFFRRDPDLSDSLRERLVRTVERDTSSSGDRASGVRESISRDGGAQGLPGAVDRGGATTPSASSEAPRDGSRVISRERTGDGSAGRTPAATSGSGVDGGTAPRTPAVQRRPASESISRTPAAEGEAARPQSPATSEREAPRTIQRPAERTAPAENWRDRSVQPRQLGSGSSSGSTGGAAGSTSSSERNWRDAPVPGRVIDSIGGARVVPRSGSDAPQTRGSTTTRPARESTSSAPPARTVTRPQSSSGSSSSADRPSSSPPARSTVSPQRSSSPPSSTPRTRVTSPRSESSGSSSPPSRSTVSRPSSESSSASSVSSSSGSSSRASSGSSSSSSRSSSSRERVSRSRPD
jgi:hypothetical protein